MNKIKKKFLVSVPSELKDMLTTENIKIELDDSDNTEHIKVEIADYDGNIIKKLNFYGYKYSREFVLDTFFDKSVRTVVDFSKPIDTSAITKIKEYINKRQFMSDYNNDVYKNANEYITTFRVVPFNDSITITINTINNRTFTYTLKNFDFTPGVSQIKTNIKENLDLGDLKNANGNTLASDITTNNVLDILKNQLKDTKAESLLESMENDFELVANDKDGTLNIKFYFQNDVIEWNVTEFLKFSNDTEIKTSNVDDSILHPKAYVNASTIKSNVFEGKTISDGFVFPSSIINIEDNAFCKAAFAGTFTLPEGIVKLENNVFDGATFNANVVLPDSIEDVGNFTFIRTTWNNNAVLVKLPNSLNKLHGGSLEISKNYIPIPLASDFTLENTKLERIEDDGIHDEGLFNKYILPANFKLPDTIKYIGTNAFRNADFSLLPCKKLIIPNYEVKINNRSGLDETNMLYNNSAKMTALSQIFVDEFLKNPNN